MLMNDSTQAIIVLGVCATVATSVISIGKAYVRSIEVERKPRTLPIDVQDRMERIEQAVDAIALEVERMSEGQRFTARLLADRFGDDARNERRRARSEARRLGEDSGNGAGGTDAH
jgi:hypothetical protein